MRYRKTYLSLFLPLLLGVIYLTGRLFGQIITEQRREQDLYLLSAEFSPGEISKEVLTEMQKFPELCRMWTVYAADVEISAEGYTSGGKVFGVDLETYPLKILKPGGQKALGTKPLLAVGEDFLKGMTDSNGFPITARQAKLLSENIASLKAEVKLTENGGKSVGQNLQGAEESPEESLREDALQADNLQKEAEFLGVVTGGGIYMDAVQLRSWLYSAGLHPGISRVCLEIRGKSHVTAAKKSLAAAGFTELEYQIEER